jgi:DNA-directed RNA polymerase subunit RPC12/RpoP
MGLTRLGVPAVAETFEVKCSNCGKKLKLKNRERIGKKAKCPKCNKPFIVRVENSAPPAEDDFLAGVSSYEEGEDEFGDGGEGPPQVLGRYRYRESSLTDKTTRKEREARLQTKRGKVTSSGTVHLFLSILGGVLGGALGAGLWVYIARTMGHEAGFAAWAVGIFTAVGMRLLGHYEGQVLGYFAIALSVVCILLAKIGVAWSLMDSVLPDVPPADLAVASIAGDVAKSDPPEEDLDEKSKGVDARNFKIEDVYSEAVWTAAHERFDKLPEEERAAKVKSAEARQGLGEVRHATVVALFWAGFTIFDSLWCIFAAVVAFVIVTSDFGL